MTSGSGSEPPTRRPLRRFPPVNQTKSVVRGSARRDHLRPRRLSWALSHTTLFVFVSPGSSLVLTCCSLPFGVKKPGEEINLNVRRPATGFLTIEARGLRAGQALACPDCDRAAVLQRTGSIHGWRRISSEIMPSVSGKTRDASKTCLFRGLPCRELADAPEEAERWPPDGPILGEQSQVRTFAERKATIEVAARLRLYHRSIGADARHDRANCCRIAPLGLVDAASQRSSTLPVASPQPPIHTAPNRLSFVARAQVSRLSF